MKVFVKFLLFFVLVIFYGCVSSGEYKARLADIENLKKDASKLENTIKAKDEEISSLKGEKAKLEEGIKLCESEKASLMGKVTSLEEDIKLKLKEKKALEEKNAKLEKDFNELVTENGDLRKTLSASKDELTKTVSNLQGQVKEKDGRIALLENDILLKSAQIATLKDESKKNSEKLMALESKIKEKDNEKLTLEKKLSEKELELQKLKKDMEAKDLEINDLKNEIRALSTDRAKALEEKERAIAELKKTHDKLVVELSEEIKKGEIEVNQLRDKLTLQMVDRILFESGSAEVKGSGKKVLDRVAEILKKVQGRQIRIEGHTDNKPIGAKIAKKFPTNWELSTARATNVVRYLKEKGGIDPKYLSAAGYAEYKPIATNDTEEGRAKNRRIEIILIPIELETLKVPAEK